MTGRLWHREYTKGNEYNKHKTKRRKWVTLILNMTGWKIVFPFSFLRPNTKRKKSKMFPQFYMISGLQFRGIMFQGTTLELSI